MIDLVKGPFNVAPLTYNTQVPIDGMRRRSVMSLFYVAISLISTIRDIFFIVISFSYFNEIQVGKYTSMPFSYGLCVNDYVYMRNKMVTFFVNTVCYSIVSNSMKKSKELVIVLISYFESTVVFFNITLGKLGCVFIACTIKNDRGGAI